MNVQADLSVKLAELAQYNLLQHLIIDSGKSNIFSRGKFLIKYILTENILQDSINDGNTFTIPYHAI